MSSPIGTRITGFLRRDQSEGHSVGTEGGKDARLRMCRMRQALRVD